MDEVLPNFWVIKIYREAKSTTHFVIERALNMSRLVITFFHRCTRPQSFLFFVKLTVCICSYVCIYLFSKISVSAPLQERGSAMGKLEPISPVSPVHMDPDLDLMPARFSKEELIQNMDRVDREITMVEQQICKLRKKQVGCIFGSLLSASQFTVAPLVLWQ